MQKIIKRYICILMVLGTMIGYGQNYAECGIYKPGTNEYNSCRAKVLYLYNLEKEKAAAAAKEAAIYVNKLDEVIVQSAPSAAKAEFKNLMLQLEISRLLALTKAGAQAKAEAEAIARAQAEAIAKAQATGVVRGGALKEVVVTNTTQTWYLDNDHDGWNLKDASQKKIGSPGPGWTTTTNGVDCNDNDPKITNNCNGTMGPWFLDKDGDGYHASVQTGTTSPGTGWTSAMTKGPDCNDNLFSANNSVCSVVTPPCTNKTVCATGSRLVNCVCVQDPLPDPCAEIKKALADAKFKEMLVNLKDPKKLDLNNETGSFQAKDGNYYPMEVFEGQPGVFVPYGSGPAQNINHVHTKQFIDAKGVVNRVFPMPSPTDIATIYTDYHFVRSMGTDPGNNYTGTINSLGYFQLRYTGQAGNLSWDQLKAKRDLIDTDENLDKFKALAKDNDNMLGFLIFMRDTLKITDIALYQVDDTGAKKIELDANNQIKETPCNK